MPARARYGGDAHKTMRVRASGLLTRLESANRAMRMSGAERQEAIHDFGGFPDKLYDLKYEPPGAPSLAQDIVDLLNQARMPA